MVNRVFKPENMLHGSVLRRKSVYGGGMGSVLLNQGGAGSGSSYSSPEEYSQITGRPLASGMGLGVGLKHTSMKHLNDKLSNLLEKPRTKKKNIVF